jgi:hypothetical protein
MMGRKRRLDVGGEGKCSCRFTKNKLEIGLKYNKDEEQGERSNGGDTKN